MQCTTTLLTGRENPRAATRSGLPEASSELLYISFRTKGALASAPSRIRYAALLKSGLCLCFAVVGVMALPEDRAYLCSPRIATLRLNFKVRVFAAQPPQTLRLVGLMPHPYVKLVLAGLTSAIHSQPLLTRVPLLAASLSAGSAGREGAYLRVSSSRLNHIHVLQNAFVTSMLTPQRCRQSESVRWERRLPSFSARDAASSASVRRLH